MGLQMDSMQCIKIVKLIPNKRFQGRTKVNDLVINFKESFKNVSLRRCISERHRRGVTIEV